MCSYPRCVSTFFVGMIAVLGTVAVLAALLMRRLLLERERAAAALERSEALFRSLVENAIDIVAVLDGQGRFVYVSPSVERILGFKPDALRGTTSLDLVAPQDKALIAATFAEGLRDPGTSHDAVCTMLDSKGEPHVLESRGSAIAIGGSMHAVLSLRDVTAERRAQEDHKRLQAQLVHAQKMETFGTLASGIAHDFNNLLTPILGGAELAQNMLPANSPARELFERIEESARRARALVQRMVLLGKSSAGERRVLDLTALVADAIELLRASLPRTIRVEAQLPSSPLWVMADDVQLQQALLNLTTNAAHALRRAPGTLRVRLHVLDHIAEARAAHPIVGQGEWAHLEVSDTGEGMDADTVRRAFEPFFSTKQASGAGLGLSVVHGIVNGHGGVIDVHSELGHGTRFDMYLPLHMKPARIAAVEEPEAAVSASPRPRILLVDDEASVAAVCRELLKMIGYDVEVATDPREALALFKAAPEHFDLVVTDHSMPHMTGLQLAEALVELRPSRVPIVLTTGFAQDDVLNGDRRALISEVVPKPYAIEELETAIARALNK